jgi:DMSO/TMAO reductase YedYZ heme-binding membrane subunit
MNALDLCADVGLAAVLLATANICLGLLIAVRYSPLRNWPRRHINIFQLHQWTACLVLTAAVLHPIVLLFSHQIHFRRIDIVFPVWSPQQPLINTLGAIALYALVIVVATSYRRLQLGRRLWKLVHYLVYPAAALAFIHGLLADPELKHRPVDWLDGEKILVEVCLLVIAATSLWAMKYRADKDRRERELHVGKYHADHLSSAGPAS